MPVWRLFRPGSGVGVASVRTVASVFVIVLGLCTQADAQIKAGPAAVRPPPESQVTDGPAAIERPSAAQIAGMRILRWIQSGAERQNYAGTIIYQEGPHLRSARLVHVFDAGVSLEKLQPLDGSPREYLRRADEVQCLMPETRKVMIEPGLARDSFPGISTGDPARILDHYQVAEGGFDRVAGYECQRVNIEPKDKLRFGYRLCIDRASGLLLRATTANERGEPVEQIWFAEVKTGSQIDKSQVRPTWVTTGWKVERSEQPSIDLARAGWLASAPPGFQRQREVVRSFWGGAVAERKVMQAVFNDGLASMSVFIEPLAPQESVVEVAQSRGPVSAYVRRVGDARVTVVGEVPPAAVKALAQSIEFRNPR
jgi:sigma-E factor negative regulatory protein RseB